MLCAGCAVFVPSILLELANLNCSINAATNVDRIYVCEVRIRGAARVTDWIYACDSDDEVGDMDELKGNVMKTSGGEQWKQKEWS